MTDRQRVAEIEREAELRLLVRLLVERERPVPPPPASAPVSGSDPGRQIAQAMRLLAELAA